MSTDPLNILLDEVRSSAFHPRTTILVAHGLLEFVVNTLVKLKCENSRRILDDSRQYPHSVKCVILHEIQLLYDDELHLLDRFRKLRNDTVHEFHFTVSNDRILAVRGDWPFRLPHEKPINSEQTAQNLVTLCLSIIAQIWGHHLDDLSAVFKVPGS